MSALIHVLVLSAGGRLATRPANTGRKNVSGSNSWALPPYNHHPVSSGSPRHRETEQLSPCAATSMPSATWIRGKHSDHGRQPLGGITMESFHAGIFNELFKARDLWLLVGQFPARPEEPACITEAKLYLWGK